MPELSAIANVCSTSARCEYRTPFGWPGGAGRVAHRRSGALVGIRTILNWLGADEERFEIEIVAGDRPTRGDDDGARRSGEETPDLLPQRQKAFVDDQQPIFGVVDDIGEFRGAEAKIQRVQDAAHQRDGEVGLEMGAVIPGQRADAIARADAERQQGLREAARTDGEVRVPITVQRPVRLAGYDLAPRGHPFRMTEDGGER